MSNENPIEIEYSRYRILIVDSDPKYRTLIEKQVNKLGFDSVTCSNTDVAKKILKTEKVDLCLSELRMPQESGIELGKWVRRIYDTSFRKPMPLPFILMTGFVHLLKQENLEDQQIEHFLVKPVEENELIKALLIALKLKKPEDFIPTPEEGSEGDVSGLIDLHNKEYCRVLLSDFVSQPILEMDIFVQLSKKKFVCIARKGEQLNTIQHRRYKDKGIEFLYIKKEDFTKIIDLNMRLNKAVLNSDNFSLEKKKRFMAKTGELILENTFANGINQETFDTAKDFLYTSLETFLEDEETATLLQILNDHSDSLYAHSLGVSIYSIMIAQKLGWHSDGNLFKLSFGALMHDIGKKDFDPELLEKPRSELTFEEKALLETHPERGKEILESLKSVPTEVVSIAYEHHENALGQGYPRYLKKSRISPMARIVSVADEFCYFAIKNPDQPGADAQKAFRLLNQYKANLLDPDALMALKLIIQQQRHKSA